MTRSDGRRASLRALVALVTALSIGLFGATARAHVVNLSQSDFEVEGATIHALVVFAKPDAVRLGRMDPDRDGVVTPAELDASQAVFRELVEREIEVTADGVRCAPTLEGGGDVQEDGFGLSIALACPSPPHEVVVSMDILRRLSAGHRHVLRIRSGDASAQAILTPPDDVRASLTALAAADARAPPVPLAPWDAIRLGIEHILTGWDHLLFLVALLLGTRGLRPVALAISAFTVAHSLTLGLAALGLVTLSPRVVEPAIALSIAYVAFENAWRPGARNRWHATFVFGLVHGFGFAGALRALALTRDRLVPTLLGFNVGVEVGQILVVGVIGLTLARVAHNRGAEPRLVRAASIALGVVGLAVFAARVAFPS